jgi:hypothetical protein
LPAHEKKNGLSCRAACYRQQEKQAGQERVPVSVGLIFAEVSARFQHRFRTRARMVASWWQRIFLAFGIAQLVVMQSMAGELPKEVARLTQAVKSVPGITEANLNKIDLAEIDVSDLSLPGAYGDLPAAALRRTKGGLPDELLLSIGFSISRDESGLKALEFLAWWTRDRARGGDNMQLRALALPPMAAGATQLGQTLHFTIDWFYSNPSRDMSAVLKSVDETGASLEQATSIYRIAFH